MSHNNGNIWNKQEHDIVMKKNREQYPRKADKSRLQHLAHKKKQTISYLAHQEQQVLNLNATFDLYFSTQEGELDCINLSSTTDWACQEMHGFHMACTRRGTGMAATTYKHHQSCKPYIQHCALLSLLLLWTHLMFRPLTHWTKHVTLFPVVLQEAYR